MQVPVAVQAQDVTTTALDDGDAEAVGQVSQLLTAANTTAKPVDPSTFTNAPASDPGDDAAMGAPIKLPTEAVTEQTDADLAELAIAPAASTGDEVAAPTEGAEGSDDFANVLQSAQQPAPKAPVTAPTPAAPVAAPPERNFADDNVDRVVSSIRTELLPTGGTMKIRLDPENLGQMQIDVTMDEGVLTASFETNNSEATRLLSHSLHQLKTALETTGVSVERIQVKQAAPAESSSPNQQGEGERQQQNPEDQPSRQEQQRREMLQRMWAKLGIGSDPLDMVA
jgi:flagellar hook-length control protein FliK